MDALVRLMKQVADNFPWNPEPRSLSEARMVVDGIERYRRRIDIDGHKIIIIFTRTIVIEKQYYHLSISNTNGNPKEIPNELIERIKIAFVPNGLPFVSIMGNCVQFLEPINV